MWCAVCERWACESAVSDGQRLKADGRAKGSGAGGVAAARMCFESGENVAILVRALWAGKFQFAPNRCRPQKEHKKKNRLIWLSVPRKCFPGHPFFLASFMWFSGPFFLPLTDARRSERSAPAAERFPVGRAAWP